MLTYGWVGAVAILTAILSIRTHGVSPFQPWLLDGTDVNLCYALVKTIMDTGWWTDNPYLGAPYGADFRDYPMIAADMLAILQILFLRLFTDNVFFISNILYLNTFTFSAWCALWALRQLDTPFLLAVCIAILYATIPYHYFKGLYQLFNSQYFVYPIVLLFLFKDSPIFKLSRLSLTFIGVLISACGIYPSAFALIILGFATLKHGTKLYLPEAKQCLGVACLVVLLISSYYAPAIIQELADSPNDALRRMTWETQFYGLRIIDMLLPAENHLIDRFVEFGKAFRYPHPHYVREPGYIGLFSVCGLAGLMIFAYVPNNLISTTSRLRLRDLTFILFFLLLWAVPGGLGSIFAMVFPEVRAMNRTLPIISMISFFGVALILTSIINQYRKYGRVITAAMFLITPLAVIDQAGTGKPGLTGPSGPYPLYDQLRIRDIENRAFFSSLEAQLASGATVYSFPNYEFPEPRNTPPTIFGYEYLEQYLYTKTVAWSYGTVRGRSDEPSELADEILLAGSFDAVLVYPRALSNTENAFLLQHLANEKFELIRTHPRTAAALYAKTSF